MTLISLNDIQSRSLGTVNQFNHAQSLLFRDQLIVLICIERIMLYLITEIFMLWL